MKRIAVIGAGLAGLVVARELGQDNEVTVFEKSRGVGGRIATRYAGDYEFDHGAQFFTARSRQFQTFLQPLIAQGVVADWQARFAEFDRSEIVTTRQWQDDYPHYVGTPRMNVIGKWLARDIDVRLQTTVGRIDRSDNGWSIHDSEETPLGHFDWVVSSAPAAQTAALLSASSAISVAGKSAGMRACRGLMLAFERPLELPFDAALVRNADISWISVNSSKPGRSEPACLVVHSSNAWADNHVDDDDESLTSHLKNELSEVTGIDVSKAAYCHVHRWRYANTDQREGPAYCIDKKLQLAACGDWFIRGRVESAYLSAQQLTQALLQHL
ncbi:MAG: FAD-dependent oxidoreductase [Woeseiaceae bacterium]